VPTISHRDEQEEIDDDEENAIASRSDVTPVPKSDQNYSPLSYSQGKILDLMFNYRRLMVSNSPELLPVFVIPVCLGFGFYSGSRMRLTFIPDPGSYYIPVSMDVQNFKTALSAFLMSKTSAHLWLLKNYRYVVNLNSFVKI
jgi:hypothetical protein